ncbi:DNA-directed RNA polymerase subunit alpha C-terminal domain-containing protein [Halalkalibacterium halodurans]|uniref:ORC-CDC6 family AAA ATPase n=1 Tax=Halalkalibacterium halodurans TaxID=86665 RepID=UPI0010FE21B3|nr:DNA-directed RNA polymerase subunit alpha C-terminal domain-containing protein [Halalkalibacterium halodurans]
MSNVLNDEFIYRTEDLKDSQLDEVFVESKMDRENIDFLKSRTPALLVGSRGTGKTMLLKIAEKELDSTFEDDRVLSIFVSFKKAIFLNTIEDIKYFRQWMLAKISFKLKRKLEKKGLLTNNELFGRYFNVDVSNQNLIDTLSQFTKLLEKASKRTVDFNSEVSHIFGRETEDIELLNELDYFHALIEDLCEELEIERIVLLFDEACHNFIPLQQREFFTLFRDLRSAYICCKAAVYPGISSFGTFQQFHDATVRKVERDLLEDEYVDYMRDIIKKQTDAEVYEKFEKQGQLLDFLIYSASGNPRLLLKSIYLASNGFKKLTSSRVNETIKSFYRSQIWNEHTKLGDIYSGHKNLIDWGREFIETVVLPDTSEKNDTRLGKGVNQQTIFFAIHRDAPETVKQAIRILEYSGIVSLHTEGTKVRRGIFDRYQVNLGIALSYYQTPTERAANLIKGLSIKLYTDYGQNSPSYSNLEKLNIITEDTDFKDVIDKVLNLSIENLDITEFQKNTIKSAGFNTLRDILEGEESDLQKARLIGKKRARVIWNIAYNATVEYFSG